MDAGEILSGTFDASHLRANALEQADLKAKAVDAANEGRPEEAAKAFEGILARLLVKEMRRGLTEGVFGEGSGSDVFESWFDEHIGKSLAESNALGIAGIVKTGLGALPAGTEEQQ
jgi:Rod binding domain-containing protein